MTKMRSPRSSSNPDGLRELREEVSTALKEREVEISYSAAHSLWAAENPGTPDTRRTHGQSGG